MRTTWFLVMDLEMVRNCIQSAISILAVLLFDGELTIELIFAASTHDQDVFSFYDDDRICNGFEEVLHRYREIVPNLRLAGDCFLVSIDVNCDHLAYFNPCSLPSCRAYIFCTNNWDGHDNSWANWWSVPCFADNCRWAGKSGFELTSCSASIFNFIEQISGKNLDTTCFAFCYIIWFAL